MDISFKPATAFTRQEEGGYTDDKRDSGNWSSGVVGRGTLIGSNMGVGAPALIEWMHPQVVRDWMMRSITFDLVQAIARKRYWLPMACDRLPIGIDLAVYDFGWNRGTGTSIKVLQRALGLKEDGDCGPVTIGRATEVSSTQDAAAHLVALICQAQAADYKTLGNYSTYGGGWEDRTGRRQNAALALIAGHSQSDHGDAA